MDWWSGQGLPPKLGEMMIDENELEEQAFDDERRVDPVTGRKEKKSMISVLNKKGRLTKHEMDEIFLEDDV